MKPRTVFFSALLIPALIFLGIRLFAPPGFPAWQLWARRTAERPSEWTAADLAARCELEALLRSRRPSHRLIYDGTRSKIGFVAEDHPDRIVFSETFGDSGELQTVIARDRVVRLEALEDVAEEVTLCDVRFYREFSGKHFYKSPPYTVVTDESYFFVEELVRQQQGLYTQIRGLFSALINETELHNDIQILIFSDHNEYRAYAALVDVRLENALGFYTLEGNRLAVMHQAHADWTATQRRQLDGVERGIESKLRTDRGRQQLTLWKKDVEGRMMTAAGEITHEVLRHEGAHQIFYEFGILRTDRAAPGWLVEGLATVCETSQIGDRNPSRMGTLQEALEGGRLIPLQELLRLPRCEDRLAYAEAWALTAMLLAPERRAGFFAYLDGVRHSSGDFLGKPEVELCRFLSTTPEQLERDWLEFIRRNFSRN
jgi:hypothetical protein